MHRGVKAVGQEDIEVKGIGKGPRMPASNGADTGGLTLGNLPPSGGGSPSNEGLDADLGVVPHTQD